jgi:pimeloyl-ACP methyl ester carboxylesterase
MTPLDTPENVAVKIVDYGSDRASTKEHVVMPNALFYSPTLKSTTRDTAIITLHGSEGYAMSGINVWLAPYIATKGYSVIAPNKRNSGKHFYKSLFDWCEEDIASIIDYLETCDDHFRKVTIIGHSLGAVEAVFYQGKTQDKRVVAMVLMGAPIWPEKIWNEDKLKLAQSHLEDETTFFSSMMVMVCQYLQSTS